MTIIFQQRNNDCGLAALIMIDQHFGGTTSLSDFEQRYGPQLRPWSGQDLIKFSSYLGLDCQGIRLTVDELKQLACPIILHWGFDHFVVLRRHRWHHFLIDDPALGRLSLPSRSIETQFTGIAFTFKPNRPRSASRRCPTIQMKYPNLASLSCIVLSGVFAMILPMLIKHIIDDIVLSRDLAQLQTIGLITLCVLLATPLLKQAAQAVLANDAHRLGNQLFAQLLGSALPPKQEQLVAQANPEKMLKLTGRLPDSASALSRSPTTVPAHLLLMLPLLWVVLIIDGSSSLLLLINASTVIFLSLFDQQSLTTQQLMSRSVASRCHLQLQEALSHRALLYRFHCEQRFGRAIIESFKKLIDQAGRSASCQSVLLFKQDLTNAVVQALLIYWTAKQTMMGEISLGGLFLILNYRGQVAQYACAISSELTQYRIATADLSQHSDSLPHHHALPPDIQFPHPSLKHYGRQSFDFNLSSAPYRLELAPIDTSAFEALLVFLTQSPRQEDKNWPVWAQQLRGALPQPVSGISDLDPLFSCSILGNLTLLDPLIDSAKVEAALHLTNLSDWVSQQPMGIHQLLNTLDRSLSPLTRLQLQLARGLVQQPKSLVLQVENVLLETSQMLDILDRIASQSISIVLVGRTDLSC